MKNSMKKSKLSKFWSNFKLKMSLLRIWFFKNIKTIILLGILIYGILVFTGNANGEFLFGKLSQAIDEAKQESLTAEVVLNILAAVLSVGSSILLFLKRTENIKLSDIKSKKLKLAMISAGLYFNSNGKLTKRVEVATKTDIDGDGKVYNTPVDEVEKSDRSIIGQTVDAISELGTILTTKIETQEDYESVMTPELKEMKQVIEETDEPVSEELNNAENTLIKEKIEENISGTDEVEKAVKVNILARFFIKIKNGIRKLFDKIFHRNKSIDETVAELPKKEEEEEHTTEPLFTEEVEEKIETVKEPEVTINEPQETIEINVDSVTVTTEKAEKIKKETETPTVLTAAEKAEIEKKKRQELMMQRIQSLYNNR